MNWGKIKLGGFFSLGATPGSFFIGPFGQKITQIKKAIYFKKKNFTQL